MGKTLQGWSISGVGPDVAGADLSGRLFGIFGHSYTGYSSVTSPTAIDYKGHTVGFGGTLSGLRVKIHTNTRVNTSTFRIRKNGTATTCLVEIPRLTTGTFLGEGTVTFVAGDYIEVEVLTPQQDTTDPDYTSAFGLYLSGIWCALDSTGGVFDVHVSHGQRQVSYSGDIRNSNSAPFCPTRTGIVAGVDYYSAPMARAVYGSECWDMGFDGLTTNQADDWIRVVALDSTINESISQVVRSAGTYKNAKTYVYNIDDEALNTPPYQTERTTTWGFVVNDVLGAPTFPISNSSNNVGGLTPAGILSGSGTKAVITGDEICYGMQLYTAPAAFTAGSGFVQIAAWGAGSVQVDYRRIEFESSDADGKSDIFLNADFSDGYVDGSGLPNPYGALTGTMYAAIGDSDIQPDVLSSYSITHADITAPFSIMLSNLRANCTLYTSGTATITVMVDGEATTQTISVTSAGRKEDTTHETGWPQGRRACLKFEFTSFVGVISGLAITQRETTDPAVVIDELCDGVDCVDGLTLRYMRRRVMKMLGDYELDPQYWSNNEIDRYINDAYRIACRDSKMVQYIEGVNLTADQNYATLSDQMGQIQRVTFEDRVLPNVTKWEMDRTLPNWASYSGYVERYVSTLHDTRQIGVYKAWDGTSTYSYGPWMSEGAHTYLPWDNVTDYAVGDRVTVVDANGIMKAYYAIDASEAINAEYYEPEVGVDWADVWEPIAFMVWGVMNPPTLEECDEPLLPPWSHLGLCFAAASKALEKYGEMRNVELSKVYGAIAKGYLDMLRSHVGNKTPERLVGMGQTRFAQMGPVPLPPLVTP